MMHGDAPPTVLSGAAMVYSRELQENRFVHISSCNTPLDWYSSVAAISEGANAAVYSFGRNNCEQHAPHPMGYNDDAYPLVHYVYCRSATRRGRECFNGETPMSSACSSTAVLVITKECGLWFSGDCPVDSSTPGLSPAPAHVFVKIPPNLFHNAGIACIAAGQSHYIAACKLGHVYCWGQNIQYALAEELEMLRTRGLVLIAALCCTACHAWTPTLDVLPSHRLDPQFKQKKIHYSCLFERL